MWVKDRNGKVPLRIDTINAEIQLLGDIAETTLTLRFRNETYRRQEGEFVMPLPAGSTVSSYALEVNGALRDGVSVEKKQARNAYETIKRQKIDPGLIEREAHNTYRTKVFPIMPKSTKLVRISYIERLRTLDGKLHYQLPIDYPGEVNKFTCNIRHTAGKDPRVKADGLQFSDSENNLISASSENKKLSGNIEISIPSTGELQFLTEKAPSDLSTHNYYFYVSYSSPEQAVEKPRSTPRRINIIWDASDSRRSRDHQKEFDLLDAYFKQISAEKEITVSLQLLRNTLQNAGEFKVNQGNWKNLRQRLQNVFYDGSTAYHKIKSSQHRAKLTLLFTDADRQTDGNSLLINPDQTTFILHRGTNTWFYRHTEKSHGGSISFAKTSVKETLHQLTHTRYRIQKITSDTTSTLSTTSGKNDQHILVGTYDFKPKKPIEITYHNGNGEILSKRISTSVIESSLSVSIIQRLWAQEKLLDLERAGNKSQLVIPHCQLHGLVSDYTSLIVLERFEDYVRFDIPPPEPDLKAKWEALRNKNIASKHRSNSYTTLIRQAWQRRLSWYGKTFSWRSKAMLSHVDQADIWLRAVQKVFIKKDLDQEAYGVIETWYRQSNELLKSEQDLNSGSNYEEWLKRQDSLIKQWIGFQKLPIKKLDNQQLTVSIRGLVVSPNTYHTDQPLTLKQSIDLAGGLHPSGSLQYVSLYRNAHGLTYNLLSRRFKDIPLLPGDMVVAEAEPYDDFSGWDFFGAETEPSHPADDPAVFSRPVPRDRSLSSGGGSEDPFGGELGGVDPFGARPSKHGRRPNTDSHVRILHEEIKSLHLKALQKFEQQLKQKKDPIASYQSIKGNQARDSQFHIEAARILNQHRHTQLAVQVISNISEHQTRNSTTQREEAYLLGSLERWKEALTVLYDIRKKNPQDSLTELDILRYSRNRNNWKPDTNPSLSQLYQELITNLQNQSPNLDSNYITYALTERNASLQKEAAKPEWLHLKNLASDIRCVIYASDPEAGITPEMREPIGESAKIGHTSNQGGRFFNAPGIDEYMLKRAIPGTYTLTCRSRRPVTLQIAFYSHWGTAQQTCQWTTVHLEPSAKARPIAEYVLAFKK